MSNTLVYILENKIYINLTNKCTNACIFCLRNDKDDVCGKNMWLDTEDFSFDDVIEQLKDIIKTAKNNVVKEIIFCGYGEPLLKLDILKEIAKYIREYLPEYRIRINTNGHANYIYKRNVALELKGLVDSISISLNAPTSEEYDELSQPSFTGAYEEVKKFIKACADEGIETITSVVEGYKGKHLDLDACKKIAEDLGATLRVREWIENGYE